MAKKEKIFDDKGREICGAKTKSRKKKDGTLRKNTICHKSPVKEKGRCRLHGGASTGPKNSLAYWGKILEDEFSDVLKIDNPLDLVGEIALVRSLVSRMQDDPLKAYCQDCRQWVHVEVECPNKKYQNEARKEEGKRIQSHFVKVRDNNFGDAVKATKLLSDIAKSHKEIQKGKEVHIKIEILNVIINRVVDAFETSNIIEDPYERRVKFVERIEGLLDDTSSGEIAERVSHAERR